MEILSKGREVWECYALNQNLDQRSGRKHTIRIELIKF